MKYDFTQKELDYINENARFNDRQQEIFDRLTDRHGRQKIVKIAIEMCLSERTISREIKSIKKKILKLI
nr:MAG TPA: response regulator [Caudoviricetes sp.]